MNERISNLQRDVSHPSRSGPATPARSVESASCTAPLDVVRFGGIPLKVNGGQRNETLPTVNNGVDFMGRGDFTGVSLNVRDPYVRASPFQKRSPQKAFSQPFSTVPLPLKKPGFPPGARHVVCMARKFELAPPDAKRVHVTAAARRAPGSERQRRHKAVDEMFTMSTAGVEAAFGKQQKPAAKSS